MPELVFFSGTMDCGKSTYLLGYPPSAGHAVGDAMSAGGEVVCADNAPSLRLVRKVPLA